MNGTIAEAVATAGKRGEAGTNESVSIAGLNVCEVRLLSVARERKPKNHKAHAHTTPEGKVEYARLDQQYKCRVCGEVVPYKGQTTITQQGKEDDEGKTYLTAVPKVVIEKETGIIIKGRFLDELDFADVKQVFRITPQRFPEKKNASKDKANLEAVKGLCWYSAERTAIKTSPLLCEYKGRPAVWKGGVLYVLWYADEMLEADEFKDYALLNQMPAGIEGALNALASLKPAELAVQVEGV